MRAPAFVNILLSGLAVALALATSPVSAAPDLTCTHTVFFDITHGSKDVGRVSGVERVTQHSNGDRIVAASALASWYESPWL